MPTPRTLAHWQARLKVRKRNLKAAKAALKKATADVAARSRLVASAKRAVARRTPATGPDVAVRWALAQVGTVEQPANSNRGPKISDWQVKRLGYTGWPWCGAFVAEALEHAGVTGLDNKRIVYTPAILADGRLGVNGLERVVPLAEARAGDLVLFNFPGGEAVDHVGLVTGPYDPSRGLPTVEGNTSPGAAGSQSNGGGVFTRVRPAASIAGIVRPRYPR